MVFQIDDKTVKLVDVGGQRNERKKWIHCFEGVTAILFVASLSEYDQKCYEDDTTNRMKESLLLFDEICNLKYFLDTSMILLLNKTDLFGQKIKERDLSSTFPEYDGGKDFDNAIKFIRERYEELNKHKDSKQIYTNFCCATDTDNFSKVFNSIKEILLNKSLKNLGI
jgi:GTPase SAR1 family protein